MLKAYLNFKNEVPHAIAFYETVFDVNCEEAITFVDAPEDSEQQRLHRVQF